MGDVRLSSVEALINPSRLRSPSRPRRKYFGSEDMKVWICCIAIIGIMSLGGGAQSSSGKDQVKLVNGDIKSGNITKEDFKGLTIASGGSVQEISWDQVVETEIRYGSPHPQWNAAYVNERNEKHTEAAELFIQIASDMEKEPTKYRDIFKQHVLYGIAFNLQKSMQYEKAINAYNNLLAKIKETKYVRQALLNKIKCFLIIAFCRAYDNR